MTPTKSLSQGSYGSKDINNKENIAKFEDFKYNQQFSSDVYNDKTKFNGYKILDEIKTHDNKSSFEGRIYKDEKNKKITIAFRGTQELKDYAEADLKLFQSRLPFQFAEAVKFVGANAKQLQDLKNQGYEIDITGHSLGGCLAMATTNAFPKLIDNCYTFNAPSSASLKNSDIAIGQNKNGEYFAVNRNFTNFAKTFFDVAIHSFSSSENKQKILKDNILAENLSSEAVEALKNYKANSSNPINGKFHHLVNINGISPINNLWWKDRPGENNKTEIIGPKWGIKQPHSIDRMGIDIDTYISGFENGKTKQQIDQEQKEKYGFKTQNNKRQEQKNTNKDELSMEHHAGYGMSF